MPIAERERNKLSTISQESVLITLFAISPFLLLCEGRESQDVVTLSLSSERTAMTESQE